MRGRKIRLKYRQKPNYVGLLNIVVKNWDFILSKWQYQDETVPEIYFREVTYDHF